AGLRLRFLRPHIEQTWKPAAVVDLNLNPEDCQKNEQSPLELGIDVFITLGLLVSYLPQHYRIIKIKSSEGLNPIFLLLGTLSATSSLFNVIILEFKPIQCCSLLSAVECAKTTISVIQLGIQWTMFVLVYPLCRRIYIDVSRLWYLPLIHYGRPPIARSREWKVSIAVLYAVIVHFLLVLSVTVYLLVLVGDSSQRETYLWAGFLGVISMMMASVQYLPQIWTTWKMKAVGALSIPMMLMQTPGAFLFAYSLASKEDNNWTTWIVFFVTGCLQGILLVMAICWHFRAKHMGYGPFDVTDAEVLYDSDGRPMRPGRHSATDERSPLRPDNQPNYASVIHEED
ncbi:1594_t:CDS:2, partial [Paraglomus occultum]